MRCCRPKVPPASLVPCNGECFPSAAPKGERLLDGNFLVAEFSWEPRSEVPGLWGWIHDILHGKG